MSQLYVPRPASCFSSTGTGGAMEPMGMTEGDTQISPYGEFDDIIIDLSGPRVPFDVQYFGETVTATGTYIFYNEQVMNRVVSRLSNPLATSTGIVPAAFTMPQFGVGSLMRTQGFAIRLFFACPYSAEPVFAQAGQQMIPAYNFLQGYLDGAYDVSISTRVKKYRLVFRFIPVWNVATGQYVIANTDNTGVPAFS